jgi:hypothetical protein
VPASSEGRGGLLKYSVQGLHNEAEEAIATYHSRCSREQGRAPARGAGMQGQAQHGSQQEQKDGFLEKKGHFMKI